MSPMLVLDAFAYSVKSSRSDLGTRMFRLAFRLPLLDFLFVSDVDLLSLMASCSTFSSDTVSLISVCFFAAMLSLVELLYYLVHQGPVVLD